MTFKAIVATLCLATVASAQVQSTPTGCHRFLGGNIDLVCVNGASPSNMFVDFDIFGVSPGQLVVLYFGDSEDATFSAANLPLPFDFGLIFPSMPGCMMMTSATGCTMISAQSMVARIPIWFPLGVSGPFMFQAMALDNSPAGFIMSANVLEYWVN